MESLSPGEQLILTAMIDGQSLAEISALIGKSERTARRLMADVKRKVEQRLLNGDTRVRVPRPSVVEPHAPLMYSDYILEKMLGAGGMGKVFRATEKATGGKVAIKALHKSRQSDEGAVALFIQEAHILAGLQHPNIVGVRGLGRFPGGGYFMVMDFVDGIDLQARLESGPMPLNEVIRLVKEVATAIQYAHERGIAHCDLKPGNVLVGKNGRVTVTDFGFAFLISGASEPGNRRIGGTAGYIAPEVLLGGRPTPAADIHALGMLMWTLVTGKLPDALDGAPATDDEAAKVHSIIRRCVAQAPHERYQSATELIQSLNALKDL